MKSRNPRGNIDIEDLKKIKENCMEILNEIVFGA